MASENVDKELSKLRRNIDEPKEEVKHSGKRRSQRGRKQEQKQSVIKMKWRGIPVLALILIIAASSVGVYAYTNWSHTITGNKQPTVNFEIYMDAGLTQPWANGLTSSASAADPYSETFYVHNAGDVDIEVTATGSWVTGSGVDVWDANPVTVPVDSTVPMTLMLSNMAVGAWSYTLTFNAAAV